LAFWLADADTTEAAYAEAVRLFGALGEREAEAEARYDLAFVAVMREGPREARQRFTESLELAYQVGRADLVAKNQNALGVLLREAGDVRSGLSLIEQALTFFRTAGDRHQLVWGLGEMAVSLHMLGERQRAWEYSLQALELVVEAGSVPGVCLAMELISIFASDEGLHAEATTLGAASTALREEIGATTPRMFRPKVDVEAVARRALGDNATYEAAADGRAMTLEQAIGYASRLVQAQVEAMPAPPT
jgi:tetratricopeptide (TPR) repeat protein